MAGNVQVSYYDLSRISSAVGALQAQNMQIGNNLGRINDNVAIVDRKVQKANEELVQLKRQFVKMIREQRQSAALQRALTEIIRVRQELEQKFGNHKLARDTMLGILQANDLKLVSKETFQRCSEELMISAPKYWLAPCVVALVAWISNNEELAYRAIKEGVRRDAEKTSLLFALICRRVAKGYIDAKDHKSANRAQEACVQWLKAYFNLLQARDMKRSIIALLDAYYNGVFGADDNTCVESIQKWINDLETRDPDGELSNEERKANAAAFHANEAARWCNFFKCYCQSVAEKYPTLAETCTQFKDIDAYLERINAVGAIHYTFKRIVDAKVDQKELMAAIDEQLVNLISQYDDDERELRKEEETLQLIKELKGDEDRAAKIMALLQSSFEENINFVDCLSNEIIDVRDFVGPKGTDNQEKKDSRASVRKCATAILHDYIVAGYYQFITECKASFPTTITIALKDEAWEGTTNGIETEPIHNSFRSEINSRREKELGAVKSKKTAYLACTVIAALVAVILGLAVNNALFVLLVAPVIFIVLFAKENGRVNAIKANINRIYDERLKNGDAIITNAINEWKSIMELVAVFERRESSNDPENCVIPLIPMLKEVNENVTK